MKVTAPRIGMIPTWVAAAAPVAIMVALLVVFLAFNPIARLREVPPAEAVAFERTAFEPDLITLQLRNDGPDPVTIGQVLVNDAYWNYSISDSTLDRLETATLKIPYPWEDGLPLEVALVTSTGLTITHEVEVAALTPELDARTLGIYALLGVYVGVIPVGIGLLWFPALRRASKRWLGFFLAFTVGLLAFLLADSIVEGIELAGETAAALDGIMLFVIGALGALLGLFCVEKLLEGRHAGQPGNVSGGLVLAYLIATGIGLHNLGEGLAIGSALAVGEIALGTFLVLGFMLHNTTEGLAIVAPIGSAEKRPALWHFAALWAVAGAPTILGALLGGFAFLPAWASLLFGVAAGAIAQVVWAIAKSMPKGAELTSGAGALGFMAGLLFMYITGLLTV
jgi:ZIP family zinc transporter